MHKAVRAVRLAVVIGLLSGAAPAGAQDIGSQLQEIRTLVAEKRLALALESLSLVARQIQDLRLEALAPAFPAPAATWSARAPLSLLEESELWGQRLLAQRTYVAAAGVPRVDLTIDVHSPLAPAAALGFNPLALAGDPTVRQLDVGGEKGLLRYNPDTGDGELLVLVGNDVLVSARGRGLTAPDVLVSLARGVDFALLRGRSLP